MIKTLSKNQIVKCNVCNRKMHTYSGWSRSEEIKIDSVLYRDKKGNKYHCFICPYSHVEYINVKDFE